MYHINYRVIREGAYLYLKQLTWNEALGSASTHTQEKVLASIFIDTTDNRSTIQSISPDISEQGVDIFMDYLEKHIGGKQVFIVPEGLKEYFLTHGFKDNPEDNPASERFRETSIENLKRIVCEKNDCCELLRKAELKSADVSDIASLMENSGFLAAKCQQYKMQGYQGFQLMCDYSEPFGFRDKITGKIVAFCRLTPLAEGQFYLGDTFVDEAYFGDKKTGTAKLYAAVGEQFTYGRIFVIAPSGRVSEFENDYHCFIPRGHDVLTKFSSPGKELDNIFSEEKSRIEAIEPHFSSKF